MRKILRLSAFGIGAFMFNAFLFSCNSNNTPSSQADTTQNVSSDTTSPKSLDTVRVAYGSDTIFDKERFTREDSIKTLISTPFHGKISASVFEMWWNASDFIDQVSKSDFIAFDFLKSHTNFIVKGLVIKGTDTTSVSLHKVSTTPRIVTSTGMHSIWIRRLRLSRTEIDDFINNCGFPDIRTNSSNYKIIFTPDLGQQEDTNHVLQEYITINVSIKRINPSATSLSKPTHPCPYCGSSLL